MEKLPFTLTACLPSATAEGRPTKPPSNYQCPHCSKTFTKPSALKPHLYTHTGEKPYQCYITGCLRRFAVLSNLRRHLKIHNKQRALSSDRVPQRRHHHSGTCTTGLSGMEHYKHIPPLLPQIIPLGTYSPPDIKDGYGTLRSVHHIPRRLQPIALPPPPRTPPAPPPAFSLAPPPPPPPAFSLGPPPALGPPLSNILFLSSMASQPEEDNHDITQALLMMAVMNTMSQGHSAHPLIRPITSDQVEWSGTMAASILLSENNSNPDDHTSQSEAILCNFLQGLE